MSGRNNFTNCTTVISVDNIYEYDGWGGGIYLKISDEFIYNSLTSFFIFGDFLSFSNCNARYGKNIFIEYKNLLTIVNNITFIYPYETNEDSDDEYLLMGYDNGNTEFPIPLRRFLLDDSCLTAYPEFDCPSECCGGLNVCVPTANNCKFVIYYYYITILIFILFYFFLC
jgi:hypothetical protein